MVMFDNTKEIVVKEAVEFKQISVEYNKELRQKINLMNEKLSEYKEIVPLLGQSIIMETVTHEFYRIYSKMTSTLGKLELLSVEIKRIDLEIQKS